MFWCELNWGVFSPSLVLNIIKIVRNSEIGQDPWQCLFNATRETRKTYKTSITTFLFTQYSALVTPIVLCHDDPHCTLSWWPQLYSALVTPLLLYSALVSPHCTLPCWPPAVVCPGYSPLCCFLCFIFYFAQSLPLFYIHLLARNPQLKVELIVPVYITGC